MNQSVNQSTRRLDWLLPSQTSLVKPITVLRKSPKGKHRANEVCMPQPTPNLLSQGPIEWATTGLTYLHRQIIRHGEAGHGWQSTVCVCEGCVCSAQHGARGEGGNCGERDTTVVVRVRAKGEQAGTHWSAELTFPITRRGGLWDWLVDTGAETTADRNMTRCVAGLSPLIPQLFFSSPFGPSIRKPYLEIRQNRWALLPAPSSTPSLTVSLSSSPVPEWRQSIQQTKSVSIYINKWHSLEAPGSLKKANGLSHKAWTRSPRVPVFSLQVDLFWPLVFLGQTHLDNGFSQTLKE